MATNDVEVFWGAGFACACGAKEVAIVACVVAICGTTATLDIGLGGGVGVGVGGDACGAGVGVGFAADDGILTAIMRSYISFNFGSKFA